MRRDSGDWRDLIGKHPGILRGKPVINGTRVPVEVVAGSVAGGMSVAEVCDEYLLNPEQVHAALAYAAEHDVD